jgi:metal-sulfur cluster biosynthetic enzyme
MNGEPKENANPKIIDIKRGPMKTHLASEVWSSINSISCGFDQFDHQDFCSYSLNRSILKALKHTSDATHGRSVSLLQSSGLILRQGKYASTCKSNYPFPIHFSDGSKSTLEPSHEEFPVQGKQIHQESIDKDEVFDIIRNIQDPEHPLTLEQLGVVSRNQIDVKENQGYEGYSILDVRFTPTIPHCSMATLIGLSIRVKLLRSLPSSDRFKVTVRIEPGTHNSELAVNKQLADKERVCAALENIHLLGLVNKCISSGMKLSS